MSEICEFRNGLWTGKKEPFIECNVIRNANFSKDFKLNYDNVVRISVEEKQFQPRELKYGDLILEKSGGGPNQPVGRVVIFDKHENGYSFSNFTSLIRIKNKELINFRFLYLYLCYCYLSGMTIKMQKNSTGIRNLIFDEYKNIRAPIPNIKEQERIVAKLDKAFEAIDKVKANAEQNLNNAKELFNDAQTTIFNEPFEEKKLGDICTLYQGLAINMKTKHLLCDKSTLPLLRIKDLKENCETQYVVEEGFPKNALVNESDIIYTRTGSLGLVFRGRKGVLHNNSFKVVPQKNISNDYLFEWLQNPIFNKKIVSLAQRAAQPDITHTLFKQQIINVPPFEIQLKKVKQINVIREYINTLNQIYTQKIKECDELKQSILQKAFRGEL